MSGHGGDEEAGRRLIPPGERLEKLGGIGTCHWCRSKCVARDSR